LWWSAREDRVGQPYRPGDVQVRPSYELDGRSLTDFVAPENRKLAERYLQELKAHATHIPPHEMRLLRVDGKVLDVEIATSSFQHNGGLTIQVVLRDISQRKQDEAETARLIRAIEQVCESIVITDAEARIIYVNSGFERVTGYCREEVLGKNPEC